MTNKKNVNKSIYLLTTLAMGTVVSLSGCTAVYEPKPNINIIKAGTVITNTAALRHTYVLDPKSKLIVCAEPAPDAGFSQDETSDVSVSLIHTGDQNDESGDQSEGSSDDEFTARTPALLITRELLYRACEFAGNNKLSKEDAMTIYMKNLEIIETVASQESGQTTIEIKDNVSNTAVQNISLKSSTDKKTKESESSE